MTRRVRVRPDRLTEPALWLDGLSYDEIAAELDAPQQTISKWLDTQNANLSEMGNPANRATPPGVRPSSLRLAFWDEIQLPIVAFGVSSSAAISS